MNIDIVLLKDFKVLKNGEEVTFPFKKTAILFAYLAINKEIDRKETAKLLWENVDDTEVRKNLRNALYTLRKVIDKDIIITEGNNKIYLNPEYTYSCDYTDLINEKDPKNIVKLYGNFLDGFNLGKIPNYQKWATLIKDNLLNIYIDACDKLIFEYQEDNKYDEALEMLQQKVLYYKYDESAYRDIMKIYLEKNEYDNAIQAYATINKILSNDLKINCERETIELYEKVVNQKLTMLKSKKIKSINNHNELILKKLVNSYEKLVKYDTPSFYLLNGEVGAGKSFLINQFLSNLKSDVELFKISCYKNDKYYVFRSIEPFIREMSYRFQTLRFNDLLTLTFKEANSDFSHDDKYKYFDKYFINMLEKVLQYQKIVLVVEDIHYMDITSLTLFEKVCEKKLDNLFIIFSSSESLDEEVLSDTNKCLVTTWDREDVSGYFKKKQNTRKVSDSFIEYVMSKTNGNPFYVKNIMSLDSSETISKDIIFQKIYCDLNENEKCVIDLLAIFVRATSLRNLKTIITMSDLDLIETLRFLEEKEIIVSFKNDLGITYQVSNESFKEYVYNNINKHVKRQLYNTIATNVELNSVDIETPFYLYQSLLAYYTEANNKIKILEYRIKLYSIKNYSACELFSIMEISLVDSLYLDHDENFEVILDELEQELNELSAQNISSSRFKEIAILFYVMKSRYHLMMLDNEKSLESITTLMKLTDNKNDIINRHNSYYLMIYYSINANDYKMLDTILDKLLNSLQLLDAYSIEYIKAMITYSRFRGYYYLVNKQYGKAIDYLKKALTITKSTTFDLDDAYQASILHYLGQAYMLTKMSKEAIDCFNKCLRILYKENLLVDAIVVTRGFLSIAYYLNGELKKAKESAFDFTSNQSYKNFYLKERLFNACIDVMFNKTIILLNPELDNEYDYEIYNLVCEKHNKYDKI